MYVSFVTIFSIVRPVRRLIAATHKLAQGGNARVVASGGIRELESLAVAFNSMAQQLSVARAATADAHQRLEAKVEERTRQLQELAEQDPLTGIANRRQLFIALNEALERSRISGNDTGAGQLVPVCRVPEPGRGPHLALRWASARAMGRRSCLSRR